MQAPWKRAASITLAASCVAAILTGCKQPSEQADDAIHEQLTAADQQALKPGEDIATAVGYYQKATTIPDGSDVAKAQAQIAFANASARAADGLIGKIEDRQVEIVKLTSLIEQQAARIAANNVQIAALKALEPKTAQDELDKQIAAAQGGSDGAPWVAGDVAAIPSTAGAKQQIATLKDQIDKLTTQKNNLQAQRAVALQQAEQLLNQSDAAKGQQSVDLFIQSADQTKKAGELEAQSAALDSSIAAAQQDLAVAQAAQTQIDASIDFLNKQSSQLKQGWSDLQKVIQERSDESAALLNAPAPDSGSAPAAAPADSSAPPAATPAPADLSIAAAAALIDTLKGQNLATRDQAEKYLNDALDALKSASNAASAVVRAYTLDANDMRFKDFPERDAWQGLIDLHNTSDLKLATALDQLRLARLYSDRAITTAARAEAAKVLDAALTPAGLTAPDTLKTGSMDEELKEARDKVKDAYAAADSLLAEIGDAPTRGDLSKSAKDTAEAVQVVELYAQAQFAAAMGDQKAAASLLSDSKRLRDDALAANIQLPPLPAELAPEAAGTISAPSTSAPSTGSSADSSTSPSSSTDNNPSPAIDRAKLLGTWSFDGGSMSQKFTFADDGTFKSEMSTTLFGATAKKLFSGDWTLNGDLLNMTIKESTPVGGAGREVKLVIKEVADDHAVFVDSADEPSSPTTYKRVQE